MRDLTCLYVLQNYVAFKLWDEVVKPFTNIPHSFEIIS